MTLVAVLGAGVLVHDPYGANLGAPGAYLKNGQTRDGDGDGKADRVVPAHRFSANPALAQAPAGEERSDWGQHNFFTWDEVEALKIGKWTAGVVSTPQSSAAGGADVA